MTAAAMSAARVSVPASTTTNGNGNGNGNGMIPLASPMRWDPHHGQISFGSLAALAAPTPVQLQPDPSSKPLFLGLDLSTQALKGCFANDRLEVVAEYVVRFDEDLPEFGTSKGVHMSEGGVVTSPVEMFLKAIDLLFQRISSSAEGQKLLSQCVAISGAAQQHATVYWSSQAPQLLGSLSPENTLADQLQKAFSSPVSPNWQDSSTTIECQEMEAALPGGAEELARRTGSRAHERFSGPQIMKLRKQKPDVYEATSRISLVSSFLTTVLCADGQVKGMEESDASGTNIWNLETQDWDKDLLEAVSGSAKAAQALREKLGSVEKDGGVVAGNVGQYFVKRYGINQNAVVNHVTGDNNATILSFTLMTGEVVVSLGTSDTILLSTTDYAPNPDTHVFSYPANRAGGKRSYMAMLCYKNGSLPREWVRDQYASASWNTFGKQMEAIGEPASEQAVSERPLGFYFLKPEIIPHNAYGTHRFAASGERIEEFEDSTFNVRAVLEAQCLSYRSRVAPMVASATKTGLPRRIYAVGGGSANKSILKVLSTILGAPVYKPRSASTNSCALGGCMKAYWCFMRRDNGGAQEGMLFEDAIKLALGKRMDGGKEDAELVAEPEVEKTRLYGSLLERFQNHENEITAGRYAQ